MFLMALAASDMKGIVKYSDYIKENDGNGEIRVVDVESKTKKRVGAKIEGKVEIERDVEERNRNVEEN